MEPMFRPALHSQRHQFVIDFVKTTQPKKVVDLGCGECSLLKKLKFHQEIELLVGVDINGAKIKKKNHKLAPVSTDYLHPSFDQLCIEMYQGSVTERDARLKGFDLVTCIELIEHLTLADVEHFSAVLFGYMTPVTVILSTPNSDFNPLLPGLTGFRHPDHKFEWSRADFSSWALKVCLEYGYEVEFTGVGHTVQSQQDGVGFCSQIGVFRRIGGRRHCNTLPGAEDVFSYTLLYCIRYPSLRDNNTLRRFLVSEVLYWAEELKDIWMEKKPEKRNHTFTLCPAERRGQELQTGPDVDVEDAGPLELAGGEEGLREESPGEVATGTKGYRVLGVHACGDERSPVEECRGGVDDGEGDGFDDFLCSNPRQQQLCTVSRCVSVPLSVLWSCCPKVSELSGSIDNLQHLLMDEPQVKLSQDGSGVLVNVREQDGEEGLDSDLEDDERADASPQCSHSVAQEEDWETNG